MKNTNVLQLIIVMLAMVGLTSCEVVGDIFEAGIWVGVILVAVVLFAIVWLVKKIF